MLISNKVDIDVVVGFTLTFDDATQNHSISCKVGDKVVITIRVSSNPLDTSTFTGIIKKIAVTMPLEDETNPVLTIDASEQFISKIYTVQANDIMDIKIAEVTP